MVRGAHRRPAGGRHLGLCGLTENDVLAQLRQKGVRDRGELRHVLNESKGELTIVREPGHDGELVRSGLTDAAGFRPATS